jgi:alkyl hydroperoxide reductase subunit D
MSLEEIFEGHTGVIPRDLKLNLKRALDGGALESVEAHLGLAALAVAVDAPRLVEYAGTALSYLDVPPEQIQEAKESAAIMGMLNTYYKFRHMTEHPDDYKSAGLRMMVFGNPRLGKVRFEMLAFALSVLNGCEGCIRSHEHALRDAGVSVEKLHDLVRLASVVKGVSGLGKVA